MMDNKAATAVVPDGAKTIHKLRIRILPFVFLLLVVALLDRLNIGFAALTMNKELAITSQQYGLIFGIFFFGYFLFGKPYLTGLRKGCPLPAYKRRTARQLPTVAIVIC